MTQEQKDLLLKDLCGRLPYFTKVQIKNKIVVLDSICDDDGYHFNFIGEYREGVNIEEVNPYIFPLSSMTKEQRIELYKVLGWGYESHYHLSKEWEDFNDSIDNNDLFIPASRVSGLNKMYNWLNKNHFDYRGLIPMGLANNATGKNIY